MLKYYVSAIGPEVAQSFDKETWAQIGPVLERPGMPDRLLAMIRDVVEMRDEWIYGKKPDRF